MTRVLAFLAALVFAFVPARADQLLGSGYRTSTGTVYFRGSPSNFVLSLATACPANQWAMGNSPTTGQPVCVQPSFGNISGTVSAAQLAAGAAASNLGAGIGTSGATLGLLNVNKTDSGSNIFSGANSFTGANTHSAAGSETFNGPTTFASGVTEAHNGTETHSGGETHTGTVAVPTPTASGQAATKGYVDSAVNTVSGGSRVLLATLTANNSASLSDTTHFTSSYAEYEIVFENVVPVSTNNTIILQTYIGGTLQTSGYTTSLYAGASGSVTSTTSSGVQLTYGSGINNAAPGLNGTLRVSNITQTTAPKMFVGTFGYPPNGVAMAMGYYNGGNGAVTGIQVSATSGNITGVIKIYGWN